MHNWSAYINSRYKAQHWSTFKTNTDIHYKSEKNEISRELSPNLINKQRKIVPETIIFSVDISSTDSEANKVLARWLYEKESK